MWWKKISFNKYFLAAITINVLCVITILIARGFLPPVVPLFYGKPLGEGQLISNLGLLIVPAVSLIISTINLLLNIWIKDNFLKKIFAVTSVIISVVGAITIIKIILLVGFF